MTAPEPTSRRLRSTPTVAAEREWPFVGRVRLLAEVGDALARGGVVLVGPAGIGKTAVAAPALPRPAARIVASPAIRHDPLAAVRALVGTEVSRAEAAARVEDAMAASAPRRSTPVLQVDDADHLDDASAAVLLQLAVEGRVRVLATRRREERPAPAVEALWREGGLRRIDVGPLDPDEATEAVRRHLGGPVDGRALTVLTALAAGNPLLLREVVLGSVAAGALAPTGDLWRLVRPPMITPLLAEVADVVLAESGAAERALVEVIALGGPLRLDLITADEVAAAERLERAGVLAVDDAGATPLLSVASPLVRAALLAALPQLARRRISARLALSSASIEDPSLALRRTVWRLEGGERPEAEELLAAARLAIEEGDTALGERLAREAMSPDGGTEAVLLASWCAAERGDVVASETLLDQHVPIGPEATVAIAVRRAEQRFWPHGDAAGAEAILAAAADQPSPWPEAIDAQRSVFAVLDSRVAAALELAEPLVGSPVPLVASPATLATTLALVLDDRAEEAVGVAEAALASLAGPVSPLYVDPGVHIIGLTFALLGAGRLVEADELTAEVYRHTLGRPGLQAQGWAAVIRAHVLVARGRPTVAAEVASEAELVWADAGLHGPARWCATVAALAHAEEGDVDALRAALARADSHPVGPFGLFEPELGRARAWEAWFDGRADVVDRLAQVADGALASSRSSLASAAAHDLVRVGAPERAVEVLDRIPSPGPIRECRRGLAVAAAAGDGPTLVEVAASLEALGADGWAAEALALAASVLPAQRPALQARAASLIAGRGLATPPLAVLAESTSVGALTAREAEVVRLAGSGLSNRDIAERLVVSLRTVENHLHQAYVKLGVSSRAEVAERRAPSEAVARRA